MGGKSRKSEEPGGSGDLLQETSRRIAERLSRATADGELTPDEVTIVVEEALAAILADGADPVIGAKAILLGVLQAAAAQGETALRIIAHVARAAVHHAGKTEEDLGPVGKGVVLGAISGAKEIGVDLEKAASTAARGALEGAESASLAAMETLRAALKKGIGGIVVNLPKA